MEIRLYILFRGLSMRTFLLIFVFLVSTTQVFAASSKDLEAQLAELQRINDAQAKNLATALNQLQEVLSQSQKLNGMVDQQRVEAEKQAKLLADSQRRLEVLENQNQVLVAQLEEIKVAGLIKEPQAKKLSELRNFNTQLAKFNAQKYKEAIASLKEFIAINPKSTLAGDAQYWVGESFFSLRDFPAAISEYQKVIRNFPKSRKASMALYKQGVCFFEMQSLDDARVFLNKVIAQYSGTPEAALAMGRIVAINQIIEERAKAQAEARAL